MRREGGIFAVRSTNKAFILLMATLESLSSDASRELGCRAHFLVTCVGGISQGFKSALLPDKMHMGAASRPILIVAWHVCARALKTVTAVYIGMLLKLH